MTSHFSTGTTRRNTPSWCKPGMYPKASSLTAGRPDRIQAWVRWFDSYASGPQIDFNELLELRRNAAGDRYHGHRSIQGQTISIELLDRIDLDHYDVEIQITIDGYRYDYQTWIDADCREMTPWGIREKRRTWNDGYSYVKFVAAA